VILSGDILRITG